MKATMNTNEKEGTVAHVELTPNDDFPLPSTFGQVRL